MAGPCCSAIGSQNRAVAMPSCPLMPYTACRFSFEYRCMRNFPKTSRGNAMSEKKRALKPPPSEAVLRELADLAQVPEVERNFYYDEILENVRNTCELKELSDGLAKEKSAKMHRSALALQEPLWDLNRRAAEFMDKVLNSKSAFIVFSRISGQGTEGLKEVVDQIARFFALLAGKTPPRPPSLGPSQRKRGKSPGGRRPGSIYNPILQDF